MSGEWQVCLANVDGVEVHQRVLPYPPDQYGFLVAKGHGYYMDKVKDGAWEQFPM